MKGVKTLNKILTFTLSVLSICMVCSCNANSNQQSAQIKSSTHDSSSTETVSGLKQYDINSISFFPSEEYSGMDFLSEEQQHVFWQAYFIYTVFSLDSSVFFSASGINSDESIDGIFYKTGYDYDSVINAFKSVVSVDIISDLVEPKCKNNNGEFVCGIGAKGIDPSFMFVLEFEEVKADDSSVFFKAIGGYGEPDGTEIISHKEFNFQMDKVDENWIVTKFELWK